jgi:hypothetical protein
MKKYINFRYCFALLLIWQVNYSYASKPIYPVIDAQTPVVQSIEKLNASFGKLDADAFQKPDKVHYPETWFHFIGGNVSKAGITADLEAIAGAGISGVQFFHGQFGGAWPGMEDKQIACLSPLWEDVLQHTAQECKRLGLRFTMQNCPGWSTSGGPWITPENSMRHLVWSRVDAEGGKTVEISLPKPQPSNEDWRDYRDVAVLAFPVPLDDSAEPLAPQIIEGSGGYAWKDCFSAKAITLPPASQTQAHRVDITFPRATVVRTIEFSSAQRFNHAWCYEPGINIKVEAVFDNGQTQLVLNTDMPPSNWQDEYPVSLACDEVAGISKYRISITNQHDMNIGSVRLFSAARKNNWEAEAGWTLRGLVRNSACPKQSPAAFVSPSQIRDIPLLWIRMDAFAGQRLPVNGRFCG